MCSPWNRPVTVAAISCSRVICRRSTGWGRKRSAFPSLDARIRDGAFSEVILATNPTVEGEATAHYIAQLLADRGLTLSRIAHGVPLGGELGWSMAAPWPMPWPAVGRSPEERPFRACRIARGEAAYTPWPMAIFPY